MANVPADRARTKAPSRRRGLSRSQVKRIVAARQWWFDEERETWWRVGEVDVKKGLVYLRRAGELERSVTFGELGNHFTRESSSGE